MILATILILTLIILGLILVFAVSTVGAGVIVLFGDVIVCGFIIGWLIMKLLKRK